MIQCTVPGHENEWIRVKEHVSRKEWKEWLVASGDEEIFALIVKFVAEWNVTTSTGEAAPPPSVEAIDALDMEMGIWLIVAVRDELASRLQLPPQPSAPSSAT